MRQRGESRITNSHGAPPSLRNVWMDAPSANVPCINNAMSEAIGVPVAYVSDSLGRLREYHARYTQLFPTPPRHKGRAREAGEAASHRTLNPGDEEEERERV